MLHSISLGAVTLRRGRGNRLPKDSIKDTKGASVAGASKSQDKRKSSSSQDASSMRVHQGNVSQFKSLRTINV